MPPSFRINDMKSVTPDQSTGSLSFYCLDLGLGLDDLFDGFALYEKSAV